MGQEGSLKSIRTCVTRETELGRSWGGFRAATQVGPHCTRLLEHQGDDPLAIAEKLLRNVTEYSLCSGGNLL